MRLSPDFEAFAEGYERGGNQVVWTRLVADLDTPVSLIDVLPTVMELVAGTPTNPRWEGQSLVPLLTGAPGDFDPRPLFAEVTFRPKLQEGARSEEKEWRPIFDALGTEEKVGFVPESKGAHGSSALWQETEGSAEYWKALEGFLDRYFPRVNKN